MKVYDIVLEAEAPKKPLIQKVHSDGSLSGKHPDGRKFSNLSPEELRKLYPAPESEKNKSKKKKSKWKDIIKSNKTVWLVTTVLQVWGVVEQMLQYSVQIDEDMRNFRYGDAKVREDYKKAQLNAVRKSAFISALVAAIGTAASIIATGKAMQAIQAFTALGRLAGPIGWIASTIVFALTQGATFLLTWSLQKYAEDLAVWIFDSLFGIFGALIGAGGDVAVTGFDQAAAMRSGAKIDKEGARAAMKKDAQQQKSKNNSTAAPQDKDRSGSVNWLD